MRSDATQLRSVLADLYPNRKDAERLLSDAKVPATSIDFEGDARNRWHQILVEAEKHGQVKKIIERACAEYPSNTLLAGFSTSTSQIAPIQPSRTRRAILILVPGATSAEQHEAREHLVSSFLADFFCDVGYENPTIARRASTSEGVEVEISCAHKVTAQQMTAECRVWTQNIPPDVLLSFAGKLTVQRYRKPNLKGVFIAIPGLTPSACEQQEELECHDKEFKVMNSEFIFGQLESSGRLASLSEVVRSYAPPLGPLSDEALLVTQDGLFLAAKELFEDTRMTRRVLVYPGSGSTVPFRVIDLLRETSYAAGQLCEAAVRHAPKASTVSYGTSLVADSAIVEVVGSVSDFDQFPASPQFFVGRSAALAQLRDLVESLVESTEGKPRVVVLNAQSGLGKSSLALRFTSLVRELGGVGLCVDSRTAEQPMFVAASLRRAILRAQEAQLAILPADASFASLESSLDTLKRCTYSSKFRPICLFFDQFENIFRDARLTREFRDLAFGISEVQTPFMVGFAWKTDLVAFTENHPYLLRDQIRSRARVINLDAFGDAELNKLLGRLQDAYGKKLHRDLRDRILEYSQRLPWLFKKLANHILQELQRGVSQGALAGEVLNIQGLFENDLRSLDPAEQRVLRAIARNNAAIPAAEAMELAGSAEIVQSLINRRMLIPIGTERFDVYLDIFRDYLNTGAVPVQDVYMLRVTPSGASKLLRVIRDLRGNTTSEKAAQVLKTSKTAVLNMARDLRLLGILDAVEGELRFSREVAAKPDLNNAVRQRATLSLRRHKVFLLLSDLLGKGKVTFVEFEKELRGLYPLKAKPKTWSDYMRAFAFWFQYAGLTSIDGSDIFPAKDDALDQNLFEVRKRHVVRGVPQFPHGPPGPVLRLIEDLGKGMDPTTSMPIKTLKRAAAEAELLELVEKLPDKKLKLSSDGIALTSLKTEQQKEMWRIVLRRQKSFSVAEKAVLEFPGITPLALGKLIAIALRTDWKDGTATGAGKWMRGWLRLAGIRTKMRQKEPVPGQGRLF